MSDKTREAIIEREKATRSGSADAEKLPRRSTARKLQQAEKAATEDKG